MPIQTRKWDDKQRDALSRGILDMKLPAKEVARRALAGTLVEGLDSFGPVPASTVRDCASREQRRRNGQHRSKLARENPAAALEQLWERLVSACDVQLAKVERQAANGRANPTELRDMARTIASLGPITRELKRNTTDDTPPPATPATAPRKHEATPSTLADELLADATSQARSAHSDTHTHIGNADQRSPLLGDGSTQAAPTHTTTDDRTHEGDDGADCAQPDDSARAAAAELRGRLGLTHA